MEKQHEPFLNEEVQYWSELNSIEGVCEKNTWDDILSNSDVVNRLGSIMSGMYGLACCRWGCHGKEHVYEYLSGRTVTSTNAAMRLIGFGYYDEALSISRNLAEIGNLVQLFSIESQHARQWLDATDKERLNQYSAGSVRKKLEQLGSVIPTDQASYSWLCEVGTHVTPQTKPQAHNSLGRPILGNVCQPDGVEVALNSLAWSVCTVSGPIAKLAIIPRIPANSLIEDTIALANILFSKPNAPLS